MYLIDLRYLGLLLIITGLMIPIDHISADLWESWGVNEGEEYEFSLDICKRYNSTTGINYTLYEESMNSSNNLVALEGEHWNVTIQSVNESGIYQIINKGSLSSPNHKYPIYYEWFWGNTENKSYWQERVALFSTNKHPEVYTLEEYTLSGDIYTEYRVYKSGSQIIMKKYSIHIGKGITTEYEIEWNDTISGSEFLSLHHLKFSLLTELGTTNELNKAVSDIIDLFRDNPIALTTLGGFLVLVMTYFVIRRFRRGKKRS
ncbi:MAG: hypothetical protein ACFFAJ_09755 [Candidatus Hodarchaeota archaeon]